MDNKALNIRNICKQRKDLQVVDELVSFFLSAFDLECEDRCSTIREIFFIKCMIRIREVFYYFLCIFYMTVNSK